MKGAFILLPPVQERVLDALATYRFLSVDLMRLAGVARDEKNLRTSLDAMARHGWIGRTKPTGMRPGYGRLPRLHWLKASGAAVLAELRGGATPPAFEGTVTAVEELPHRLGTLETHVRLRLWAETAGMRVEQVRTYYDPAPSRDRKATTIASGEAGGTFTPDALAQVVPPDGAPRPLVIEVYRGGRNNTLSHFRGMLPTLREACTDNLVEQHLGATRGARFLILFADAAMRDEALKTWPEPSAPEWSRFFVKAMADLTPDFAAGWRQPGGRVVALFGP